MKIFYQVSICLFVFMVLLSSCSLQKRHYRNGYNLQWNKDAEQLAVNTEANSEETKKLQPIDPGSVDLTASLRGADILLPPKEPALFNENINNSVQKCLAAEECDVIIQRNGKEIKVKVLEVKTKSIKYTNCDDAAAVEKVMKKAEVSKIVYSNGSEEIFADKSANDEDLTTEEKIVKHTKNLALFTLLLGVLSFVPFVGVVPGVLAVIFANIVFHKYRKNDMTDKKIKKRALGGLLLGIVGAILSVCLFMMSLLGMI